MTLGLKNKNGVILKVKKNALHYYKGMNDSTLSPLFKKGKGGMVKIKTVKVFEPVVIANNAMTVTMYPNGNVELKPNQK